MAPVRHRDAQPGAFARAAHAGRAPRAPPSPHRAPPAARSAICTRRPGRRVLEHAGPAEVVEVVAGPLRMRSLGAEAGDRAVHERRGQVVGADPEPRGDAGPEPFEHDVRPGAERQRANRHVRLQVADRPTPCRREALGPTPAPSSRSGSPPGGSIRTTRAPSRTSSLPANGDREVPGELDDEDALERLRVGLHDTYSDRVLTDRSIARERPGRDRQAGSEEKRRLILDAAVRVFARDGYHTSRVGDIAEEAGVAHGLLYHYFSSKEEVLATLFRENWGELLGRFARVEQSDEPADEQLRGIAKILLRTWRNDPDLVRVMVREVARSSAPAGAGGRDRSGVRDDPAGDRARPGGGRLPAPTSTRGSRAGSSTAGSRRSSRAGCSASFPTVTRRSPVQSGRSSTSSAAVSPSATTPLAELGSSAAHDRQARASARSGSPGR